MSHDQTTPVALHKLIARLLDDHQRVHPHHADLCPLCQDTMTTLDLLADEVPEDWDRLAPGPDTTPPITLGISRCRLPDCTDGGSYR